MKALRSLLAPWFSVMLLACTKGRAVDDVVPPDDPAASSPVARPSEAEILAASDLPAPLAAPLADDPLGVTIHRLSNGMTVYISTMRDQPRIAAWVVVRAGSRMDPADSTGLAHYLEHMLFKGTDELGTTDMEAEAPHVERVHQLYAELPAAQGAKARAAILGEIDAETLAQAQYAIPNEFDRLYGTLGVEGLNAWTDNEETVYLASIPSNRLEQWARVESERFADPVFRLFYPELEAVYEEKNLSLDEPDEQLDERIMRALFPRHPYGTQTTIGSVEHLRTPAYQDMVDYFERWYVPNNMAVVLVGDVDPETALPVLELELARLRPQPLERPQPGELAPLHGRTLVELQAEGEELVVMRWPTAPVGDPDGAALAVMTRLLGDPSFGLLETELVLPQRVTWAGARQSSLVEAGYLSVELGLRPGQRHEDGEAMARKVVERLRSGDFEEADVAAARLQIEVDAARAREASFVRAYRIMEAFTQHRPWPEVVREQQALQEVTKADVVRVAKAFLGDDYVVGYRRQGEMDVPRLDKPKISPVPIDSSRHSAFAEAVERMPVPALQPQWAVEGEHYQRRKVATGELVAVRNPRNELFSVEYRVERGFREEPLLCFALELLELSGAGERSAEQRRRELYALGSQVSVGCSADTSWIEIEGLDRNMEATLALVREWLAAPRFDDEVLQGHLRNTIAVRRDELEEDRSLSSALFELAMLGERSEWRQQPSNATLAKAKAAKLRGLMTSALGHRHRTIYYGPRSADEVEPLLVGKGKVRATGAPWVERYREVSHTTVFFLHDDGAKANVRIVIPQPPLPARERALAELYEQTMDGNSGSVIFQEIREARGLAYTAWLRHDDGRIPRDQSVVLGGMSTQADKTPESVTTFLELLQRPLPADRVAEAKASLDQSYRASRIDPRQLPHWVVYWEDRGDLVDPRRAQWEALQGLEVADVEAFAQRFRDRPLIIAVIGDRERVGLERLAELGPVVELKAEDLFSYGAFPEIEEESGTAEAVASP
ncbi:MAG: insulinase family protein [Myxococcales bacterium]|nr:insulinase family protein [Myxococcales bacterium]